MQTAISVRGVTKAYKLYSTPLLRMWDVFTGGRHYREFTALKDITADFPKGEVIAILGKNGSGKSTLLRIIAGVTSPTRGEVSVQGRISAMLELTSGFDMDLTGMENIYLKALTMGIPRKEIRKRLESIVAFADIGEHINEPVRTYSSGMRARLGFAISVSVDPDILVIDEVLAVGDDIFRLKCIERMKQFRLQGKTILFVSHSLFTVKAFCTKAMWLNQGELVDYGDIGEVVARYENFLREEKAKLKEVPGAGGGKQPVVVSKRDLFDVKDARLCDSQGKKCSVFNVGDELCVHFKYIVKTNIRRLLFGFTVFDAEKRVIFASDKRDEAKALDAAIGEHSLFIRIKTDNMLEGRYYLSGELWDNDSAISVGFLNKRSFQIKQNAYRGSGVAFVEHSFVNDGRDGSQKD